MKRKAKINARSLVIIIALAVFLGAAVISVPCVGAKDNSEIVDRIVATVNDEIISLSEMNQVLKVMLPKIDAEAYTHEEIQKVRYQAQRQVLEQLVDQKLTAQEARRLKLRVSAKQVDNAIERVKASNHLTEESLREGLKKRGMSYDTYRQHVQDQILRARLVNYEVKSKIVITKKDIQSYYDRFPKLYVGQKRYRLRDILLRVPQSATSDEKAVIHARIQSLVEQLKQGVDFESLAKQHSQSPSAADGGLLGEFSPDMLSPQIRTAVGALKSGQFSDVTETDFGYQIFLVEDVQQESTKSLQEVSREIEEKLYRQEVDKRFKSWLKSLRQRSHIKIIM